MLWDHWHSSVAESHPGSCRGTASCSMCCTRSHHTPFRKGFRSPVGAGKGSTMAQEHPPPLAGPHLSLHQRGSCRSTSLNRGLPETLLIALQGWLVL